MQRILIATELWLGTTGRSLADGFRAIGCDVNEVDCRHSVPVWSGLALRAVARAIGTRTRREYLRTVCRRLESERPSLFLTVKGTHLDREVFDTCRHIGTVSAVYYPDYHFDYRGVDLAALLEADHFITTKSFQVDFLRKQKRRAEIHFLHHGYAPVHRPLYAAVAEGDYACDVVYVGTYTPHKEQWLATVRRLLPEVSFDIFGEGWQRASSPEIKPICRGGRYGSGYAQAVQTSRVNIAVHMEAKGVQGWADNVSMRTFEIPACKGFMLHIDNDEVRTLYDVPEEIDVFSTPEELAAKIRHYLARPEQRRRMIDAAFNRCVPAYSHQNRARQILELTSTRADKPARGTL
jgi:spore maturation protein CgeB